MPMQWCTYGACGNPAVQRHGDCELCDRHFCRDHLQEPYHNCPKPEEDCASYCCLYTAAEAHCLKKMSDRIVGSKLCSRASQLRSGIPCDVDLSSKSLSEMMGNQNCHAEIVFHDGKKWLARFRLNRATSLPPEVNDFILRSEAATMNYLRRHTHIPVPAVFDFACESDPDNEVGVSYILMEKIDGRPLDWQAATPAQREKITQQVADIMIEMDNHPFDSMGSLIASGRADSDFDVQGFAQHSTYQVGAGGPLGPFSSSREGYRSMIDLYLSMIVSGELGDSEPLNAYLMHRFRLETIDNHWQDEPKNGRFFLKHPDDKGDHILVNDDFDIVGLIDWEWTRTASRAEAFSSPAMMWPVTKFYNGCNELAPEELRLAEILQERDRGDLSECIVNSRKVQRLLFGLGHDYPSDQKTVINLFMGFRRAFEYEDEEWEQLKCKVLETWKIDKSLQEISPYKCHAQFAFGAAKAKCFESPCQVMATRRQPERRSRGS